MENKETDTLGFEKKRCIGRGAYSEVFEAVDRRTDKEVAIKAIYLPVDDQRERGSSIEEVSKEIRTQCGLQHPNVVPIHSCLAEVDQIWIVMPLYQCSVYQLLRDKYPDGFSDMFAIAKILKHTLLGLEYVHKSNFVHRDIKAANILLSKTGEVKVSDFGTCGNISSPWNLKERKTFTGTICWMAPEVMEQTGHTYKADIWSFGMTALELMFGEAPTARYQPLKAMITILQENSWSCNDYLKQERWKKKKVPDCFKDFIKKCLQKNPSERLAIPKLLKHKFITKYAKDNYDLTKLF
jgi:serine/threonine-protein kinase OSR1/STK39